MIESELQRRIMVAMSNAGARVFRNQVGQYPLQDGRVLRSGLCVGSSDLIGWHSVEITPDMIGRRVAVFTAVEVKGQHGRLSGPQQIFLNAVRSAGGIAVEARDVDSAVAALKIV